MIKQKVLDDMHNDLSSMREQLKQMSKGLSNIGVGWSDWEPHTVGIIPMRINGRWYFKGDRVFRKEKMLWLTGNGKYIYGDEFDVLKEKI